MCRAFRSASRRPSAWGLTTDRRRLDALDLARSSCPPPLQELTYIIKQDISDLNSQIASLQQLTKASSDAANGGRKKEARQVEEHNSNVVMLLQSKLAEMGIGFKDVLEIRTQVGPRAVWLAGGGKLTLLSFYRPSSPQNMKASKDRTEQFMYTSSGPASAMASSNRASSASSPPVDTGAAAGPRLRRANGPPASSSSSTNPYADAYLTRPESILNAPPPNRGGSPYAPSPAGGLTGGRNSNDGGYSVDQKGKGRGDYLALDLEDAEGGRGGAVGGGAQGMQMQMMEEQVRPNILTRL